MITSKEEILAKLKTAHIDYQLFEHHPAFTAEDGQDLCIKIPGPHVKNLFLRDKKKKIYLLVTVKQEKRVDLLKLGDNLQLGRLSFASSNDLNTMLGVEAGSVTPIAMINDAHKRIKLFMDRDLLNEEIINIHPMVNTATISIKLNDLLLFIEDYQQEKIEFIEIP